MSNIREKFYLDWYPTLLAKSGEFRVFTGFFIFIWTILSGMCIMCIAVILKAYGYESIEHFFASSQTSLLQVGTIYSIWNTIGLIAYLIAMREVIEEELLDYKKEENLKKLLVKNGALKEDDADKTVEASELVYQQQELV